MQSCRTGNVYGSSHVEHIYEQYLQPEQLRMKVACALEEDEPWFFGEDHAPGHIGWNCTGASNLNTKLNMYIYICDLVEGLLAHVIGRAKSLSIFVHDACNATSINYMCGSRVDTATTSVWLIRVHNTKYLSVVSNRPRLCTAIDQSCAISQDIT